MLRNNLYHCLMLGNWSCLHVRVICQVRDVGLARHRVCFASRDKANPSVDFEQQKNEINFLFYNQTLEGENIVNIVLMAYILYSEISLGRLMVMEKNTNIYHIKEFNNYN